MTGPRSRQAFARARTLVPGGVNSPVRAFGAVGGTPPFIAGGSGPRLIDEDGRSYLDYVCSWGPLILGHAHPAIVQAVQAAVAAGSSYGAPTVAEVDLAEEIVEAVPGTEMVRCVSSGTEATMTALRLARGVTGRPGIVKFAGHYHGHSDALLAAAGSGVATFALPDSAGVTPGATADTIVLPWNDQDAVAAAFADHGERIAAVICEPVAANMGVVPAAEGFLEHLRAVTAAYGALLIFDEVLSGFRVARGGMVARSGVRPDLVTLGKVVGGGFPLAAFAGRGALMQQLAPQGPVYQAGTLSGNPVAVAAGLAQLRLLDEAVYATLEDRAVRLRDGLVAALQHAGLGVCSNRVGSLFSLFFTDAPVTDYEGARRADHDRYRRFFHGMLERGQYLPPSGYEALFVSAAHSQEDIDDTVAAAQEVAAELARAS